MQTKQTHKQTNTQRRTANNKQTNRSTGKQKHTTNNKKTQWQTKQRWNQTNQGETKNTMVKKNRQHMYIQIKKADQTTNNNETQHQNNTNKTPAKYKIQKRIKQRRTTNRHKGETPTNKQT